MNVFKCLVIDHVDLLQKNFNYIKTSLSIYLGQDNLKEP